VHDSLLLFAALTYFCCLQRGSLSLHRWLLFARGQVVDYFTGLENSL
jgi:hypothetical protein